jgi:hypothetical protein
MTSPTRSPARDDGGLEGDGEGAHAAAHAAGARHGEVHGSCPPAAHDPEALARAYVEANGQPVEAGPLIWHAFRWLGLGGDDA